MAKIIAIIFAVFLTCCFGFSTPGVPMPALEDSGSTIMEQDTIVIQGRIFIGGHEPFPTLSLEQEDGTAVVLCAEEPLYKELWTHQNQILKCRGKFIPDVLHEKTFYVIDYKKVE